MITSQAKWQKRHLREIGAVDSITSKAPRAETDRKVWYEKGVRCVEYGSAVSFVKPLTPQQIDELRALNPSVKITHCCVGAPTAFDAVRSH